VISCNSGLRANITIRIRCVIIRIHIEDTGIRAIIRVPADIDNVVDAHNHPFPRTPETFLKSDPRAKTTTRKRSVNMRKHNEDTGIRAIIRGPADKDNAVC